MGLVRWTPEKLIDAARRIQLAFSRFDEGWLVYHPQQILSMLQLSAKTTVDFGGGGLALFTGVRAGHDAALHFILWDPQYMRRHRLLRAALRWFMDKYDLHRVSCMIPHSNTLSRRLAEKIGFTHEGDARSAVRYNGKWVPAAYYGILREDL